jgi:hypothetical protein
MSETSTITESVFIPHTAFADAAKQINECWYFSKDKSVAEGLAIIGPSRVGKTSLFRHFLEDHPARRESDGMKVPVLYASVPSTPTVKSLAGVMLESLQSPDAYCGTQNQQSSKLRTQMKNVGTQMVIIDEFQHFCDSATNKVMHDVADWLKILIDDTKTTLVIGGLPRCKAVIDQNEQLAGRFLAPIELPRFDWENVQQRQEFVTILDAFREEISKQYKIVPLATDSMAFRFYCATGGLIGYLSNLLRKAERNAISEGKSQIRLEDLDQAFRQSIWDRKIALPSGRRPFELDFETAPTKDILQAVRQIGVPLRPSVSSRPTSKKPRVPSVDSLLVTQ